MKAGYTNERNIQQIIYLLKAHGIKRIIANPGSSNVSFIASVQNDSFFDVYSVVDERSAAYLACGMSAESGEPVVLCCTGATSSRNYIPGLTEAYYRKLPILAITAMMHPGYIGQNKAQVIDRSVQLKDIIRYSGQIDIVYSSEDEWANEVKINSAIFEMKQNGGGPAHLNMVTVFSDDFSVKKLPKSRAIYKVTLSDQFPELENKRIGIFVGAHKKWDKELIKEVDTFCEKYNAYVIGDHTSNYTGKYFILGNLISNQSQYRSEAIKFDIVIDMGDISGSYIDFDTTDIWRVNPDGVIRDNRKKIKYVFEMKEEELFRIYNKKKSTFNKNDVSRYEFALSEYKHIYEKINRDELPFSNVWTANITASKMPLGSVIHFAILNSLRAWNFFEYDKSILGFANTGGFGIDGCTSSLIGASIVNRDKLYFGVTGDLAFFYDLNIIGNRHIGKNIRILLVNNGLGTEFKNYSCIASQFEEDVDVFISAAGHYGKKSPELVKNFVEALGFDYLTASSKREYIAIVDKFVSPENKKSIVLEIFTDSKDESDALYMLNNLEASLTGYTKNKMKQLAKSVLGTSGTNTLKKKLKAE